MLFKNLKIGQAFKYPDNEQVFKKINEEWRSLYIPANCVIVPDDGSKEAGAYANENDKVEVVSK